MSPSLPRDYLAWHDKLEAEYQLRMQGWSDIAGQMPLLREAARAFTCPAVAELGTRTGQSTAALLAGASASGGHVYSVDEGPIQVPDWWTATGMWSFLNADDMSEDAKQWLPPVLDVLFIDTSHLYQHTLDELREYVPRVRQGGIVLCHDPELTRDATPRRKDVPREGLMGWTWLQQAAAGPEYPVAAALDVFCAETGLSWSRQPDPSEWPGEPFYGLGTIVIPYA